MARKEEFDYDLLVIGTGGAGTAAAIRGSELGAKVGIAEGAEVVGGTCVNVGCIPSKFLIEAAGRYYTTRTAFSEGVPCEPKIAWRELQQQKRELIATLRQEKYIDVLDSYEGVTVLRGQARLLGTNRVRVGEKEVSAGKIVVATGAQPFIPPIPGLSEANPLTSTTIMELEELPESLIVIGAGAVGLELGQVFRRFGKEVTVLDIAENLLPNEDREVSEALREALQEEGMSFRLGATVNRVSRTGHHIEVEVEQGGELERLFAEQLLIATGRAPNSAGLGLEEVGVELNSSGFIIVDSYMRTSNPDVFGAGDVVGGAQYVYVAALSGTGAAQTALQQLSGQEAIPIDLAATPRVTFTDPQVATVGLTEGEARQAGIDPKVTTIPAGALPRALVAGKTQGIIKLVADNETDKLLGVHLVTANAGDSIGEAVLAIKYGMTVQKLVATLHPYLTWTEGLKLAGQTFTKDIAKLSCCA